MALGRTDEEGSRLQHLRAVLPCEVRVVGSHPLVGSTLLAQWFRHRDGVLVLGVDLPDGSRVVIPAEVTDVFGGLGAERAGLVLDAAGVRSLRALVARLAGRVSEMETGR